MKSFLQRQHSAPLPALRPPGAPATAALERLRVAGSPAGHGGPGSRVEVVKEGDKVVRLVVTCACGERIEVECLYAAGS